MTVLHADDWLTVHHGDARAVMAEMEHESVQCVAFSPPFYGLRDYGLPPLVWGGDADHEHVWGDPIVTDRRGTQIGKAVTVDARESVRGSDCACGAWLGSLGLEPDLGAYVDHLVEVCRAVWRVLRKDGIMWINLGDSYASHDPGDRRDGEFLNPSGVQYDKGRKIGSPAVRNRAGNYKPFGLKAKDLIGVPWTVAFALRADGWYLRRDIVWSKPNPMPESVEDRASSSHEYVFMLTRSRRYYYDSEAVREPAESGPSDLRKMAESRERIGGLVKESTDPLLRASSLTNIGRKRSVGGKQLAMTSSSSSSTARRMGGFNDRWDASEDNGSAPVGRNKRSVWTIATEPYPGAHFATWPTRLVEPMILAGCPERVCSECGRPWERVVERTPNPSLHAFDADARGWANTHSKTSNAQSSKSMHRNGTNVQAPPPITTGWRPSCGHDVEPLPGVVLDCFAGSGTTALVANRLGRRAILIDLSEDYLAQAIKRIGEARGAGDGPGVDMPVPFADDGLWADREAVS